MRRILHPARHAGLLFALALTAPGSSAQTVDARLVPRGLLRIGFSADYTNYDRRFARNSPTVPDGHPELLGTDFTSDSAGSIMFPAIRRSEQAIGAIIGDSTYRINLGAFRTTLDADIRRFPLDLALGLTDRITLTAHVPLVTHRMQVDFQVDSTGANVGWNQAMGQLADAGNASAIATFLMELATAIDDVDQQIAAGGFGCPGSAQCLAAQAALARARALDANLRILNGEGADAGVPSFAPLVGSAAGAAVSAEIAAVITELQSFGASPVTSTFALPATRLGADDMNRLLSEPGLGYDALPLAFERATRLGDVQLGLRVGLIQTPRVRAVLTGAVTLPTGKTDRPDHFADLGTGDRQTDVTGGFEAAFEPARGLGIAFGGWYTVQLADDLVRRVGPPDSPILPAFSETLVHRDLGNVVRLAAYPVLHLTEAFSVFGTFDYYRKAADRYTSAVGTQPGAPGTQVDLFPVSSLGRESRMEAMSFGGGIRYATTLVDGRMPIEAGLRYRSAFSGSGGLTPKANRLTIHLRLFYNVFRPVPDTVAPPPPPEPTR